MLTLARVERSLRISEDGNMLYGVQENSNNFNVVAIDMQTGKERIMNSFPQTILQASEVLVCLHPRGSFATSIARAKSDIWLLEQTNHTTSFFDRFVQKMFPQWSD